MIHAHSIPRLLAVIFFAALFSACGSIDPASVMNHEKVAAENLGENVNSTADDYGMVLFQNRLIFTSKRPTAEGYIQGDDLWFSDREGKSWSHALNYGGTINSVNDEGSLYITPDGEYVYYVQCDTEDGLGDCDIYMARMDYNGKWQDIRNLGESVNSKYWDSQPYVSPDGEYLYFASDRPGGYGGTDIWRSKRLRNGKWGKAQNLGPQINTGGDEKSPTLAPNGVDLFFSSNGHRGLGGMDLFRSILGKDDKWSPAVNIGQPFNSRSDDMFFRLSPMEDTVFIASSRSGGLGALDIWAVWPNPFKDTSRYEYWVRGVVFDTVSTMGLTASSLHVRPEQGAPFTVRPDRNGRYQFKTKLGAAYEATASAEGYESLTLRFSVPQTLYYNEYRRSFGLGKPRGAEQDTPEDVVQRDLTIAYFEFDKSEVRAEYRRQIQEYFVATIKPLIDKGAEFGVQLDAHTDDIGTEDYNIALSRRRGAAVSAVLKASGVPLDAIRINAYGKSRPVNQNESEEARSLNRRVEIRIERF
jgi:outer membrane protein OmpA-like peptidoglycan-associated protein